VESPKEKMIAYLQQFFNWSVYEEKASMPIIAKQ